MVVIGVVKKPLGKYCLVVNYGVVENVPGRFFSSNAIVCKTAICQGFANP